LEQSTGPKYLGLVHALREAIASGELNAGDRLPPVRNLAWDLKITPGTVARAYRRATDDGLLAAAVGRGTFIAETRYNLQSNLRDSLHLGSANSMFDLRGTKSPDLGQDAVIRDALQFIAKNGVYSYADYPDPANSFSAAQAISKWLSYKEMRPNPENIALTYGAQNGMLIALQTILTGPSPVIVTDELVYPGLRHAGNMLRCEIVSVERDRDGILPDALEQACRKHGPQVFVSSFTTHSPTAQTTTLERCIALADVARKYEMQIIDDDAFGIFDTDTPSIQTIAPERVWYIGALSKSVSTGLRTGYLITPTGYGDIARTTVLSNCYGVSQIVCDLANELLSSGAAETFRQRMLAFVQKRSQMAVNVLGQWDINWSPNVPFIWLKMPSGWRASSFQRACEKQNVLVRPADEFALIDGKAPNAARIAFGATLSDAEFEKALQVIASVLQAKPAMNEL
jgi:DNA-binding transcriptional MocR family regulator